MNGFQESLGMRYKNEMAKLKAMTFKEKREHIWEYYKLPIAVTVLAILILGSLINTWFINPPKKDYLLLAWMGNPVPDEQLGALAETLTETLVENPAKERVTVSSFVAGNDAAFIVAMQERLMAMMVTGEIDIFILNSSRLNDMAGEGNLLPLDKLVEELTREPEYAALYDKLIFVKAAYIINAAGDKETHTFGINLRDCPLFTSMNIDTKDMYLCLAVNTKKIDRVAPLLEVLYE
jgi:hypothetical protein